MATGIPQPFGDYYREIYANWPNDTELSESLVRRAESASYSAIVLTVDNSIVGWKPRDLQQAYLPFLEGIGIEQYLSDPVFRAALEKPPEEDIGAAVGHFLGVFMNPALTWDRLEWLRDATDLPIVIKGILHPDDAALALGADAVMVGRPYLWGLALEGEQGVETVMRCILAELDLTLALSGHTEPAQLEPSLLRPSADA